MREQAKKFQVYIVDDHQFVRESLTDLLSQEANLKVCGGASTASRAEKEILDKCPDLAIVDLSLQGSSGFELIRVLHNKMPNLRILALSMYDEKLYAERCIRAGAHGYLMKRESSKRIVDAVLEVLGGKRFVSEHMANVFMDNYIEGNGAQSDSALSQLSDRELEVFALLGQGLDSRKIAATLDINLKTVQSYYVRIKQKMHLATASELLREATRWHYDTSNT